MFLMPHRKRELIAIAFVFWMLVMAAALIALSPHEVDPASVPRDQWIAEFQPQRDGKVKVWFDRRRWCIMEPKELAERLLQNKEPE